MRDPVEQVPVGLDRGRASPLRSESGSLRFGGVAAQRLLRHAALARDLQPPREERLRVLDHPQSGARGWGASTARSRPLDDRGRACRSGRSGRGCRRPGVVSSRRRPHIARARSRCASESAPCMPVSNSTKPSSHATAQALQCGTPGQGSGRRSRKTPGSTRSPRPSSRLLLSHLGHAAETRLRPTAAVKEGEDGRAGEPRARPAARCRRWPRTCSSSRPGASASPAARPRPSRAATSRRSTRATSRRAVALWAQGGRENVRGQVDALAPEGVREFIGELLGAMPGPRACRSSRPPPRASAAGSTGA